MDRARRAVAANLRTIRTARGLTVAALADASGMGKATLSRIEAGQANPTLETLYALADALQVSWGTLVAEPPARTVHTTADDVPVLAGPVEARLLTQITGVPLLEGLEVRFPAGSRRESGAHPRGVVEHLFLISGRLRAGPLDAPEDLDSGDVLRFAADVPHVYEALDGEAARAVLLMTYPVISTGDRGSRAVQDI
ncbi:helix-turn-helix domain-containing protein [Pseudonocardia kunmingensis]|uniref:helix-turn-helix domain-containing protein n=1 Tax=Pseudonocardia kunmingensis TaxID=630975 RepID=UPI00147865E4|nr:XRE family transcriptional regulator [Pseudonocardia kunmingensis]